MDLLLRYLVVLVFSAIILAAFQAMLTNIPPPFITALVGFAFIGGALVLHLRKRRRARR